jgi:hypothetical protein
MVFSSNFPQKKGVSVPAVDADQARPSVIFIACIEQWYYEALLGLASVLQEYGVWYGDEEAIQDAVVAARDSYKDLLGADCMGCLEFRVNSETGELEYRYGETGEWISTGSSVIGPTGEQGLPGETDVIQYPGIDETKTSENARCATAMNFNEWLFEGFNDDIDEIESMADIGSAIDAILAIFPPAYLLADAIVDAINEVVEAGVNVCRAWDTTARREEWAEYVYCVLDEDGNLTTEAWDEWVGSLPTGVSPGNDAYVMYLGTLDSRAMVQRAQLSSYGETQPICSTFLCAEWSEEFDFSGGNQHGFTPFEYGGQVRALWVGDGWKVKDISNRIQLDKSFPVSGTVSYIHFTADPGVPATAQWTIGFPNLLGTTYQSEGGSGTGEIFCPETSTSSIGCAIGNDTIAIPDAKLVKVILAGSGENPFA